MLNKVFEFPASLKLDNKGQKLYKVQFGISGQVGNTKETFSLIDKGSHSYILYSNSEKSHIILDEINGKNYLFRDDFFPLKYEITADSKMIDNIILKKAKTEFRGREYVIWFDSSSPLKGGPWKFTNLPGIAYEIYDVENLFHWSLQSINKLEGTIKKPFTAEELEKQSILYTEYPKLKYTSSVFFSNGTKSGGSYQQVQQNRDGLEKIFEWEK